MTPSPTLIARILRENGPIWVNGSTHITVIAGIRDINGSIEVLVFDPAINTKVHGQWHDFYQHYQVKQDTQMDAAKVSITSMLYLPTMYRLSFQ